MDSGTPGEVLSFSLQECSTKGGECVYIMFCNPMAVPDEDSTYLFLCGCRGVEHRLPVERASPTTLTAIMPAHPYPENVSLSLCSVSSEHGQPTRTIYTTTFTYFEDAKQEGTEKVLADLLQQSFLDMGDSLPLLYRDFPMLNSPEEVRRLDSVFCDILSSLEVPLGWSMVGALGKPGTRVSTVNDCEPRETLLHFAARHGLNSVVQHLLSLPGSSIAVMLRNEQGKLPIDLAREGCNDGLVALLTLYMKQVSADGKLLDSATPSPKESPSHAEVRCKLPEMGGVSESRPRGLQGTGAFKNLHIVQEMVRINAEWRKLVKCRRKNSLDCVVTKSQGFIPQPTTTEEVSVSSQLRRMDQLLSSDQGHTHQQGLYMRARWRRNSCAFARCSPVPPEPRAGDSGTGGEAGLSMGFHHHFPLCSCLGCANGLKGTELLDMDRRSNLSWSMMVGLSDCRSVDTGLNELSRITAEESLQKKLSRIREELLRTEQSKRSSEQHLSRSQSVLKSISCPEFGSLDDDDEVSVALRLPLSTTSSPRHQQPLAEGSTDWMPNGGGREGGRGLQLLVTADQEHSETDLLYPRDVHNSDVNTGSPSPSQDDLDTTSSLDQQDIRENDQEYRKANARSRSFLDPQVSLEADNATAMYSSSAPDLLSLSDEEDAKKSGEGEEGSAVSLSSRANPPLGVAVQSVEESIVEHRPLRQVGSCSPEIIPHPAEMSCKNTKKTIPDTMEGDFVVVRSPQEIPASSPSSSSSSTTVTQTSAARQSDKKSLESSCAHSLGATAGMVRQPRSTGYKSHRRSLSMSDVDVMRMGLDGGGENLVRRGNGGSSERPNTSNNFVAVLTPISGAAEGDSPPLGLGIGRDSASLPRRLDLDEHSQADSIQTLDTSSHQGSDESDDMETDDQLSALESRTSLDYPHPYHHKFSGNDGSGNTLKDGSTPTATDYKGIHNLSAAVTLRSNGVAERKKTNKLNRFSAENVITNIDDEMNPESAEEADGESTPTSGFPKYSTNHRRIHSTNAPYHTDGSEFVSSMEERAMFSSSPFLSGEVAIEKVEEDGATQSSVCGANNSVFDHSTEGDVVNLSDVDVRVARSNESRHLEFNVSIDGGNADINDRFLKRSGSPKTIRRLTKGRKHGGGDRSESPSRGLQKEEVRPTIKQLRLITMQDECEDSLSDDNDSTSDLTKLVRVGSAQGIHSSSAGATPRGSGRNTPTVQRSSSSISDTVTVHHRPVSEEARYSPSLPRNVGSTDSARTRSPSGARSPLPSTNLRSPEEEGSSLDYVPGSPLATKKLQQMQGGHHMHPPTTPLSFSLSKSPPAPLTVPSASCLVSSSSAQELQHQAALQMQHPMSAGPRTSGSASAFLTNSSPGMIMPTSLTEEEEEEKLARASNHVTPEESKVLKSALVSHKQSGKTVKTVFLHEDVCPEPQSRFVFDPSRVPLKDAEETTTKIEKEQGGSKKGLRGFFLGGKQGSKKITKVTSAGTKKSLEAESIREGPPPGPQTYKHNRAKSAKVRKPNENFVDTALLASLVPVSPSSITRSASMQVGLNVPPGLERSLEFGSSIEVGGKGGGESGEGGHSKSMTHHVSDGTLTSPVRTGTKSVTIMDIIPGSPKAERSHTDPVGRLSPTFPPPLPPRPQTSHTSGGESDNDPEERISLSTNHPALEIKEEAPWEKTIDRKMYRKMHKAERERQAILHELLHTEKQHFRALHVLKIIFRTGLFKLVTEETLDQLFPQLDQLIEISDHFRRAMESRCSGLMIDDLSDVLLDQFSYRNYDSMLSAFGDFCSGHLYAMEIYRELSKKKSFARVMKEMHSFKECQRLELPDYYTKVTQRLPQVIILLNRLVKKTESLQLPHYPVIKKSLVHVKKLVAAVDQAVEDRKNMTELIELESRLEISMPKSDKVTNPKDLKNMSLMAHNRKMMKRGDAIWIGTGRQLAVQVVLVTDFLVFFTERDQKIHLANLQDKKPPAIRLFYLMVRNNAAVKSGEQLILIEQTSQPEIYKLDFGDRKKAKQWLNALNTAIEECKQKGLKCEHFGADHVTSGDEEKKTEEKEMDSEDDDRKLGGTPTPTQTPMKMNTEMERHSKARLSIDAAMKLISLFNSGGSDNSVKTNKESLPPVPNTRLSTATHRRSNTVRPKTAYFAEDTDALTSATIAGHAMTGGTSGDHVISHPIPVTKPIKVKEKKKVNRSSTFRKERKEDKKEERDKLSALASTVHHQSSVTEERYRVPEQQYVNCIKALQSCLEEVMSENETKNKKIDQLCNEVEELQEELQSMKYDKDKILHHRNELASSVDVLNEAPSQASSSLSRPYSSFVDLNNIDGSTSLHHSEDSAPDLSSSKSEVSVLPELERKQEAKEEDTLDRGKKRASSTKWSQKYVLTKNGRSSPVHNSKT